MFASIGVSTNTWWSRCCRAGVLLKHTVPTVALTGSLALLLAPAEAFAASPEASPFQPRPHAPRSDQPQEVDHTWYGYQLAVADAAWITAAVAMREPLFLSAYPFTGVITHALHGRPEAAIGSLVLRLLLPVGLAVAGPEAALYASATAVGVDVCALSWETTTRTPTATTLVPVLSANRQLAGVAIRGVF